MLKVTKHVDWISVTFPESITPEMVFPSLEFKYVGSGIHGYKDRFLDGKTGAQFFSNGHSSSMGVHAQLSGAALSQIRKEFNVSDNNLVNHLTGLNGKIGRIDLAINIHGGNVTPKSFFNAVRAEDVKTSSRKTSYVWGIEDGIEGMTTYLGNRHSDRFLRCYDKNAELKIVDADAWVRFELELKRVWANGAQKAMTEHSTESVINSHFADFMQWGNREYNQAISGESAPIDEIGRKDTNTEKWLIKQCIPALARVCYANPGFLARFMKDYRNAVRELENATE